MKTQWLTCDGSTFRLQWRHLSAQESSMQPLADREKYISDGKFHWWTLPFLIVGALITSVLAAVLLRFAFANGFYLIILAPLFAGGIVGGATALMVGLTHCRNQWVAGGIGLLAGLLTFPGYYAACILGEVPAGFWPNAIVMMPQLLPEYIQFRVESDVVEEVGKARQNQAPPSPVMNWILFGAEWLLLTAVATGIPHTRARQAYSPELKIWMRRETALLPPFHQQRLQYVLETGTLAQYLSETPAGTDVQKSTQLILEYAFPPDGSSLDFPVFATLGGPTAKVAKDDPAAGYSATLRQIELEPQEVLLLLPRFPKLAAVLGTQHPELREVAQTVVAPVPPAAPAASAVATVEPVPDPYRQKVRSGGYTFWVNMAGLSPVLYLFGGIGVAVGGGYLLSEERLIAGVPLTVLGAGLILWGLYTAIFTLAVPENRLILKWLKREIARRSDVWVDPSDPEAVYVSLIPREHFAKVKLTMSTDLLFLKLDPEQGLLMEGDTDRYLIPPGAIRVSEAECFFHPMDGNRTNELWMVRLLVEFPEGPRELLLSIAGTSYRPYTNAVRRTRAAEMATQIGMLRNTAS